MSERASEPASDSTAGTTWNDASSAAPGAPGASASASGPAAWLAIHDELLRGIAHTLSNRVATIDVTSYMLESAGVDVGAQAGVLRDEASALERLVHAMRMLPARDEGLEPIIAGDAVSAAVALHEYHEGLRAIPCTVEIDPDTPPLHAHPVRLQHALVAALTAARESAGAEGSVVIRVRSDGDTVTFDASAGNGHRAATRSNTAAESAAAWLLESSAGTASAHPGGCRVSVPTLQAARRRAPTHSM